MMKMTNYAATTPFDVEHGIEATEALPGRVRKSLERAIAAVKTVRAQRHRTAQLMSLDDRILRDIGIAEAEIRDLRARRQLLPPHWAD
jgi:uncharacterized protein YjiS (DUF1127 family)